MTTHKQTAAEAEATLLPHEAHLSIEFGRPAADGSPRHPQNRYAAILALHSEGSQPTEGVVALYAQGVADLVKRTILHHYGYGDVLPLQNDKGGKQ